MIYTDLDIDVIDFGEDFWWRFYLREHQKSNALFHLLNLFSEIDVRPVRESVHEDEFQVILHDANSGIFMDLFNSAEFPSLYLGVHRDKFLPSGSAEARLHADQFLEFGKLIYRAAQPTYGFADNLNLYIDVNGISAYNLSHICWAQFFGPEYVRQAGQETLSKAPAWRNENLPDGGLLYVLAASPYWYRGARQYWQQARDYFAQQGFPNLQWSDQPS